jgi:hypothetical protein
MKLIGNFRSPYVRHVAIRLNTIGLSFELQVSKEAVFDKLFTAAGWSDPHPSSPREWIVRPCR